MQYLNDYIKTILGVSLNSTPVPQSDLRNLPLYIREAYKFYYAHLFNQPLVLAAIKKGNEFSNMQIEKHLDLVRKKLNQKTALVSEDMTAINRRRLIEKGISFI